MVSPFLKLPTLATVFLFPSLFSPSPRLFPSLSCEKSASADISFLDVYRRKIVVLTRNTLFMFDMCFGSPFFFV